MRVDTERKTLRWTLVLVAVVAVQVAIPAVAATLPLPARFGWQMYSGLGEVPDIAILTLDDGTTRGVSVDEVLANGRPEIDWGAYLPPYYCGLYPHATSVTLKAGTHRETHEC